MKLAPLIFLKTKRTVVLIVLSLSLFFGCGSKYDDLEFYKIAWDYNSNVEYNVGSLKNGGSILKFIDLKLTDGVPFKNLTEAQNSNNLIAIKMYKELQNYPELEKYKIRTAYKKEDNSVDTLLLEYDNLKDVLGPYLKLYEKTTNDLDQLIETGNHHIIIDNLHPSLKTEEAIETYMRNARRNDSIGGKITRVELIAMAPKSTLKNEPVLLFTGWISREKNRKQRIEIGISNDIENPLYHVINFKK